MPSKNRHQIIILPFQWHRSFIDFTVFWQNGEKILDLELVESTRFRILVWWCWMEYWSLYQLLVPLLASASLLSQYWADAWATHSASSSRVFRLECNLSVELNGSSDKSTSDMSPSCPESLTHRLHTDPDRSDSGLSEDVMQTLAEKSPSTSISSLSSSCLGVSTITSSSTSTSSLFKRLSFSWSPLLCKIKAPFLVSLLWSSPFTLALSLDRCRNFGERSNLNLKGFCLAECGGSLTVGVDVGVSSSSPLVDLFDGWYVAFVTSVAGSSAKNRNDAVNYHSKIDHYNIIQIQPRQ